MVHNTQTVDSAVGESHQPILNPQLTPGLSSLSRGSSSHSSHLETGFQALLPNHDGFSNSSKPLLTKRLVETLLSPDRQWYSLHDAQEVSGGDAIRRELQIAADPAQVMLAEDGQKQILRLAILTQQTSSEWEQSTDADRSFHAMVLYRILNCLMSGGCREDDKLEQEGAEKGGLKSLKLYS